MKKMIHWIMIVATVMTMLTLAGCQKKSKLEACFEEIVDMEAEWGPVAYTPQELPDACDLVVLFLPDGDSETNLSYFYDGLISSGSTVREGTVTRVLKGEINEGDRIQVTEVCYTTDDGNRLWTIAGYLPMMPGKEYFLFLKAYDEKHPDAGKYYIGNLTYGKYIPGVTRIKDCEVTVGVYEDRYLEWMKAVHTMYPEVFGKD